MAYSRAGLGITSWNSLQSTSALHGGLVCQLRCQLMCQLRHQLRSQLMCQLWRRLRCTFYCQLLRLTSQLQTSTEAKVPPFLSVVGLEYCLDVPPFQLLQYRTKTLQETPQIFLIFYIWRYKSDLFHCVSVDESQVSKLENCTVTITHHEILEIIVIIVQSDSHIVCTVWMTVIS